jgi:hypothetical protein
MGLVRESKLAIDARELDPFLASPVTFDARGLHLLIMTVGANLVLLRDEAAPGAARALLNADVAVAAIRLIEVLGVREEDLAPRGIAAKSGAGPWADQATGDEKPKCERPYHGILPRWT